MKSIKHKMTWSAASQFVKIGTQLFSLFYLTKIISPSEYGIIAIATIAINFSNMFNDMGVSSALIQKPNLSKRYINLGYSLNILFGLLIMICLVFISYPVSLYFEEDKLSSILLILSTTYPIIAISTTHRAYMEKIGHFKQLAIIESVSSITALLAALILANYSFGAFSIVIQLWLSYAISGLLICYCSKITPKVTTKIKKSDFKELFNFGSNIFLFNLLNYVSLNLDKFLIARSYSSNTLGMYSIAHRIMMIPASNISFILSRVLLPHFSNKTVLDDKKRTDFMHSIFIVLVTITPAMIGLSLIAEDLFPLLFNENWYQLPIIFALLAPIAITKSILDITGAVIIAAGKTKTLLYIGGFGALSCSIAVLTGVNYGMEVFCLLYLIGNILYMIPALVCSCRILTINTKAFLRFFGKSLAPTVVMALSILTARYFIDTQIESEIRVALYVLIGITIYLGSLLTMNTLPLRSLLIK